jgi:hypothetical protein
MAGTNQGGSRIRHALLLFSVVFGITCGGDASGDGASWPAQILPINVSISPNPIVARQGFSVPATVTFSRTTTSTAPLTLTAKGLSPGLTATFNPATLTTVSGTSQLTITATQTASLATDTLIVSIIGDPNAAKVETGSAGTALIVTQPQVTVSKAGTGSGTVTSSPAGINCGSTCSAGFAGGSSVTLTAAPAQGSAFAGWTGGCTSATTTCTVTAGGGQGAVIATFNSTAASISLAVDPTVAVPQGGSGTANVTIARNNFAGTVNLAVTGAPTGLTVTPNPPSVTGTTATLNVAAALSIAVGNYPITLTATGTGIPQQTATIAVQVTPAPGGNGNVVMSFASCDPSSVPVWFAVQNGNGAWTRLTATNNTYAFTPGATGGYAYVTPDGPGFRTQVLFATASEMATIATGPGACFADTQIGTKRVNGTVSHNNAQIAKTTLSIGGAQAPLPPNSASYSLFSVPAGRRDLLAVQATSAGTDSVIQSMILRRNVNYANNTSAPDLDMIGAESFVPTFHQVGFTNLAGDQSSISISFVTANGQSAPYYGGIGRFFNAINQDGVRSYGVPDSLIQPGDFHLTSEFAVSPDGKSGRLVESMFHKLVDQTLTFGPALATPTVTTLASSPYLRLRTQLPSQSAYNGGASAEYDQGNNTVEVTATAGYFGGMPANWIIDVPDFAGASYDAAWGLHTGTLSWLALAAKGDILPFFGAPMFDGAQITIGLTSNGAASFNVVGGRARFPHH